MVIACDGIWDVMSSQAGFRLGRRAEALGRAEGTPQGGAGELLQPTFSPPWKGVVDFVKHSLGNMLTVEERVQA